MESGNNLKRSIVSSMFWKLIERGGSSIVGMVVQIVMARLLAPEQFGMLSIILVFVNLGNVFVQSGLNTALIQSSEVKEDDCSTVFWLSFGISLVLCLLLYIAAPALSMFYAMPDLTWPLRALSLLMVINAYNAVQVALVTRNMEMNKLFRATLISSLSSAVLGITSAALGFGIWALVVQQMSYQLINCLVLAMQVAWHPTLVFSVASARRLFGFGSHLLVSGILNQLYQSLSDLIIGKQFSASALGLVSQGKKYPNVIGNILDGAIQPVMLSAVSRVQDNREEVKRLVRRALKTSTFLIAPSMVLFAAVAPRLVPLLLGDRWIDAVWFMQVYCLVYALLPIHTTNLQALNGMGRSDVFLKLEIAKKGIGAVVLIFCAVVLRDIKMIVLSYLLTGLVSSVINAWPNRKIIGYSYWNQVCDVAPAFLLSALSATMSSIVTVVQLPSFLLIVMQVALFAIIYLGLSALFRLDAFTYLVSTGKELLVR